MSGSRHDWPDDETAERLLRGEPADAGNTGTDEFDLDTAQSGGDQRSRDPRHQALAALLSAAAGTGQTLEQGREDAALAAFRQARAAVAGPAEAAPAGTRRAHALGGAPRDHRRVVDARERFGRLRGWPGPAKAAVSAVFAATVLAGGVAAAVGVIPSPFSGPGMSPRPDGSHRPLPLPPQMPDPAGSQSSTPTAGAPVPQRPPGPEPSPDAAGDGTDIPGPGLDLRGLCDAYLTAKGGHGAGLRIGYQKWLDGQAGGARFVGVFCHKHLGPVGAGVSPLATLSPPALGGKGGGFGLAQCGPSAPAPTAAPSGPGSPPGPTGPTGSQPPSTGPTASGSPSPSASLPPSASPSPSAPPSGSPTPPAPTLSPCGVATGAVAHSAARATAAPGAGHASYHHGVGVDAVVGSVVRRGRVA